MMSTLPPPDGRHNYYLGRDHRDMPQILRGGRGKVYDEQGRLAYSFPDEDRWFILTEDGPLWDREDKTKLKYFDDPKKALRYLRSM